MEIDDEAVSSDEETHLLNQGETEEDKENNVPPKYTIPKKGKNQVITTGKPISPLGLTRSICRATQDRLGGEGH